jgi:hypothetical protein
MAAATLFELVKKAHPWCRSRHDEGAVVVAMRAMRVVQMTFDEEIGVVAVRNSLVTAIESVPVLGSVSAALVLRCAAVGILPPDGEAMFIDMAIVDVMEMSVV